MFLSSIRLPGGNFGVVSVQGHVDIGQVLIWGTMG